MSGDNLITDGSNDQKYFINTPQIVLALCRNPYDYTLWNVIKMVAGENGVCKLSTPDLATLGMMSTGKASDSRAYLLQVGLLEGSLYREPNYPQPVWHLHIPDIWLQNITWRQLYNSLKDRVELKAKLKALFEEADIYRRFVPENFLQLDGLQDVNVKSLHNMKPSQYEEGIPQNERGVSQNEGGIPQNETKKNHVEPDKTRKKNAAAATAAPPQSVSEKEPDTSSPIQEIANQLEAAQTARYNQANPPPIPYPPPRPEPVEGAVSPPDEDAAFSQVCRLYQAEIGQMSPLIAREIRDKLRHCPPAWFEQAISKAAAAEARRWNYIKSILAAWEKCGGPENDHRPGKNGANNGHSTFRQNKSPGRESGKPTGHDLKREPVFDPYTGEILQPGEY